MSPIEVTKYGSHEAMIDDMHRFANTRVVIAMGKVKRDWFLEGDQLPFALHDMAIAIPGYSDVSSNSQPSSVARMTGLTDVLSSHRVLEIGTASGYQAAILSHLAREVVSVEYIDALAHKAQARFREHNIGNVHVLTADGSTSFAAKNSFDRILITASMPPYAYEDIKIFDMIKEKGRVVMPMGGVGGDPASCDVVLLVKVDGHMIETQKLKGFSFVPMEGANGWSTFTSYALKSIRDMFPEDSERMTDSDLTPYAIKTMHDVFHPTPPGTDIFFG